MSLPVRESKRIVSVSNEVAEYPPLDLTKLQYQALLILISCIDSTAKPIYGIDDIVEEIRAKGITDSYEQMQYLEELINQQNTYRIPYRDYLRFFTGGETPQGGVTQRALEAVLSLNNKPFKFNNPEYEGSYIWFQAVAVDKKTNDIVFVISSFAKPFLMGLRRDFLQMLAESTMNFDGKYSVPIYLYMKSKLFDGRSEYHGTEPIEIFKRRFGLDGVKTYEKFYDFQRRILDVAEQDSLKSADVRFVFTGKPDMGSKKVAQLQYSIYRIGEIKGISQKRVSEQVDGNSLFKNKEKTKDINNEITKTTNIHQEKLTQLSESKYRAYEFLVEKGINKAFIVDKILMHPNLKYELLRGYEDVYFKLLWDWFLKHTKSQEKAGAFVTWWKNGRLTRETMHWQIVEVIRQRLKEKERKEPTIFDNKEITKSRNNEITQTESPFKKMLFDLKKFKKDYSSVFDQIVSERKTAFAEFKDIANFNQMLENSILSHCEQWWRLNC